MKYLIFTVVLLATAAAHSKASTVPVDDSAFISEHLHRTSYALDTSASAVILYEREVYSIEGGFIFRTVRRLVKILKKEGARFGDISIGMKNTQYHYGGILKADGKTYNLVNNKLLSQQMPAESIKITKSDEYSIVGKFSLPAVAAGSVIDYSYQTKEALTLNLGTWEIQGELPKLNTEMILFFPETIKLALMAENIGDLVEYDDVNDSATHAVSPEGYFIPVRTLKAGSYMRKWVRKNVPATAAEPFVYNPRNYAERMELQILSSKGTSIGDGAVVKFDVGYARNWKSLSRNLKEDNAVFGQLPADKYGPARKVLTKIEKPEDRLEYAKNIYNYVRDSFSCKEEGFIYTGRALDWVLRNRYGNKLDLQLALVTLLREAGFEADPVLGGFREQLRMFEAVPLLTRINYIVTRARVGKEEIFLDPTNKNYSFGVISPSCYNGFAWVVNDTGMAVYMDASRLKEKTVVQARTISEDIAAYTIGVRQVFGKYTAIAKRDKWQADSREIRRETIELLKKVNPDAKLVDLSIHNLFNPDTSLIIEYSYKAAWPSSGDVFFTPAIVNYLSENPFHTEARQNPVEMPYAIDFYYNLNLTLPENYHAENIPESKVYKLDDEDSYKYQISYAPDTRALMLNTRLTLQKTYFDKEQYGDLKLFFRKIMELQQTNILLKKNI